MTKAVSHQEVMAVSDVANSIATAIGNGSRSPENPVLSRLATDPLAVLQAHGLSTDFFKNAQSDYLTTYTEFLKSEAQQEFSRGRSPRNYHWYRCWACRIGLGAIVVALGVALAAATSGLAPLVFELCTTWIMTAMSIAEATAQTMVTAATATVGFAGGEGITKLIEVICEAIPNTCA